MQKKIIMAAGTILFALLFLFGFKPVAAADIGLGVQPVLPENQRDACSSYFDFIAAPNVATTLTVNLSNDSDAAITVDAVVVPAETSSNGAVSYVLDTKTTFPTNANLAKFADKAKQTMELPANSVTPYTVTLTMPAENLSGLVAGGIIFKPQNQNNTESSGISVKSEYQYVISVVARNVDQTWQPELKITAADVEQVSYSNLLNVTMANPSSTFLNQLHVEETVTRKGTDETYKKTSSDMQMAPNTTFKYGVDLPDNLKAGVYAVKLTAFYVKDDAGKFTATDGQKYRYAVDYAKDVTLTAEKARTLTKKIAAVTKKTTNKIIYGVAAGVIVLVLIVIFLIIFYRRKRRENLKLKAELEQAKLANKK